MTTVLYFKVYMMAMFESCNNIPQGEREDHNYIRNKEPMGLLS
jgi:hypothetical protein